MPSSAAYLLQEVAPSTAQFHAGGRRPRGAFPVCVAFEPLNSPSAFLWVHRHAVHRLDGGPAVGRHPSHVPLRRPSSGLRQEAILLGMTVTFRPHRRASVVLRRFPASQRSTGKMLQCCSAHALGGPAADENLSRRLSTILQGQRGLSPLAVAYKCAAGWREGTCRIMVALSISITLSSRTWGLAVQCERLEPGVARMWSTRGDRGSHLVHSNGCGLGTVNLGRQKQAPLYPPASHLPGLRREGGRVWHHHLPSTAQSSSISVRIERWIDPANERIHSWILPCRPQTERLLPWNAARAVLAISPARAVEAAGQMESVTGSSGPSRRLFAL